MSEELFGEATNGAREAARAPRKIAMLVSGLVQHNATFYAAPSFYLTLRALTPRRFRLARQSIHRSAT
jgi:hypothetical protein